MEKNFAVDLLLRQACLTPGGGVHRAMDILCRCSVLRYNGIKGIAATRQVVQRIGRVVPLCQTSFQAMDQNVDDLISRVDNLGL